MKISNPVSTTFIIVATLFLVYLLLPGPSSIEDFPPLPNSAKSTLEGDTIQVPNVAAYFSNNYREFVVDFYRRDFLKKTWLPFLPLRLNHPPEYAYIAIKVETHSTYLEEYYYPLRDSLFVNGLEPFEKDGTPKYTGAIKFDNEDRISDTKVTLRYYPSSVWVRILVWLGICSSIILLWKMGKKVIAS